MNVDEYEKTHVKWCYSVDTKVASQPAIERAQGLHVITEKRGRFPEGLLSVETWTIGELSFPDSRERLPRPILETLTLRMNPIPPRRYAAPLWIRMDEDIMERPEA